MDRKVVGKQCVFVKHFKENRRRKDSIIIREIIHYDDGGKEPVLKMIREPLRPYYVTSKPYRNHKQKKTVEKLNRLSRYECTDSKLAQSVANSLEMPYERRGMRELNKSPYIYNTDYSVSNIYKRKYINKYPEYANKFLEVCNFDIETNTEFYDERLAKLDPEYVNPEEIFIITMDMGDKHYIGVTDSYLGNLLDIDWEGVYRSMAKEHLSEHMNVDNIEVVRYNTERELIIETFRKLHQWNPDLVAIWNKIFDIPYIERRCDVLNIPKHLLYKNPAIPNEYGEYWFIEGPEKKYSESDKGRPLKPSERHHYLVNAAGFEIVDAMISYRLIRTGSKELPSYALDYILKVEGLKGKLKIISEEGMTPKEWHDLMRTTHKIEYMIYANFDTRSMTLLDDKTKDLKLTLGSLIEDCEYRYAHSSTKRVALDFAKHARADDYICSSRYNPDEEEIEEMSPDERRDLALDYKVLGKKDWILTLPAFMADPDMGIKPFKDYPDWSTQVAIGCSDVDITSSYPSCLQITNGSRETLTKEIISIEGIDEETLRMNNLNLLCGKTSHLRYSNEMYGLLSISEITDMINEV